jgi:hypothetical protein
MEVRCRRYEPMDGRRYKSTEVGGRVATGAATGNYVWNTTPGKEELE